VKSKSFSWFLLIALSLVWGSSFILMKRGMDAFSSQEVAAMRISMAFLVLLPVFIRHFRKEYFTHLKALFLTGIFGNLIPAFLFTAAETQISSGLAGMLNALTPVFTVILSIFWLRIKVSRRQVLSLFAGLLAAVGLMAFDSSQDNSRNILFGLLVVAATVCYAISVNVIKKYLSTLSSIGTTAWAFTITGPIAMVYLFLGTDFTHTLSTHTMAWPSLGYTAVLAVVGSALSVMAYNSLIKSAGTVFASSCTYLIPIVAVFWGFLDGESVNFPQILCVLTIIFSVYLVNRD
jgi:drug/metabolite transporter (DMT)-like permease